MRRRMATVFSVSPARLLDGPVLGQPPRKPRWRAPLLGFALVGAAASLAFAWPDAAHERPTLTAYVQHGLSVQPVQSGAILAAGDTVALTYTPGAARFVGVWRQSGTTTQRLFAGPVQQAEGHVAVPHPPLAVQLSQTFYAVFCASEALLDGVVLGPSGLQAPGCWVEAVALSR